MKFHLISIFCPFFDAVFTSAADCVYSRQHRCARGVGAQRTDGSGDRMHAILIGFTLCEILGHNFNFR